MIVPLARISPSNYANVRQILSGDLPDRYQDWLYVQAKAETDTAMGGNAVKPIPVDPGELARYCEAHDDDRNQDGLVHFVQRKAEGEQY